MADMHELAATVRLGNDIVLGSPVGSLHTAEHRAGGNIHKLLAQLGSAEHGNAAEIGAAIVHDLGLARVAAEGCKEKADEAGNLFSIVVKGSNNHHLAKAVEQTALMSERAAASAGVVPEMQTKAVELMDALSVVIERAGELATMHASIADDSRDVWNARNQAASAGEAFIYQATGRV